MGAHDHSTTGYVHVLLGASLDQARGERVAVERRPVAVLELLLAREREDRSDAWVILGMFDGDHRSREDWRFACGLMLDLDWEDPSIPKEGGAHQAIPDPDRHRIVAALRDFHVPGFAYLTVRGLRWGCIFDEDQTDADTYGELAQAASEKLLAHLDEHGVALWRTGVTGLRYDSTSGKPAQPMRLPLPAQAVLPTGPDRPVCSRDLLQEDDVPRLDLDAALPERLADACRQIAGWLQIAPEVVVTGFLSLVATAIGNSRWVTARGISVPVSLHYLTVLPPGSGKSEVRKYLRKAAEEIEAGIRQRRTEWQSEHCAYLDALDRWKAGRRRVGTSSPPTVRPKPPPPSSRGGERVSFIVREATMEAIVETLEDSPRGVLWATDEAHEVLGLLGRYGDSGGARSLDAARLRGLMESQPVEAHRVRGNGSPIRRLARPWLAIDADVQPGVFARLFAEEDHLSGLTARLLVHAPPALQGQRKYLHPTAEPAPWVPVYLNEVLSKLWATPFELREGAPAYQSLPLDAAADRAWAQELERLERRYGMAGDEEAGHLGHLRGRILRLAGVLTLLRDPCAPHVTLEDMQRAIVQARYHLAHHRRLLGVASGPRIAETSDRLRERVEAIHRRQPETGVRPSDLRREVNRSRYDGELGRRRAVADLHGLGWILRRPHQIAGRPGRPPVPAFFPPGAGRPSPKPPKPRPAREGDGLGDLGDKVLGDDAHSGEVARELLDRASARLLATGDVTLPAPGTRGPCPVCGSSSGFGTLPGEPQHWYCHSERHRGGGCAVDLHFVARSGRAPTPAEAVEEARRILGMDRERAAS